jgi:microbial collagenase
LLQFSSLKPEVRKLVKEQTSKYSMAHGGGIWIVMASHIDNFDKENCDYYGTCNYKQTAEKAIFAYIKVCPITKKDQFTIKAQKITPAQLDEVCQRLKSQEDYFHKRLETNWQPVADDYNNNLNVVIYASSDDYKAYNFALYGLDTNNGGIYIEGDPSQPGNVGSFYCYVQYDWDNNWDVWNLEHEVTHYFDGRYDLYGDFYFASRYSTVWWSEGLGEYIANRDDYPEIRRTCSDKKYSLSAIFDTTYDHGTERVYYYGYSAVRFLFEKHQEEVRQLLTFFRKGKLDEYTNYIKKDIGKKYDAEYSKWCDCVAKGQC